jgi:hypothetical protein
LLDLFAGLKDEDLEVLVLLDLLREVKLFEEI